jgi:phosphatidylserine decarboxylase
MSTLTRDAIHTYYQLPITTPKEVSWEAKHSPILNIRAKYEPYDALRQKFWRQYAAQYDVDETGKISHTELTAMLDSLGSTLTHHTIESFFKRFDKSHETDELTMDEVVQCMEREVTKSKSEKAKVHNDDGSLRSGSQTPAMAPEPAGHGLDQDGPEAISSPVDADQLRKSILKSVPHGDEVPEDGTPGNLHPINTDVPQVRLDRPATVIEGQNEIPAIDSGAASPASGLSDAEESDSVADDLERVINIRSCPLCHRRRLKRKSEQDIVTHLAICASSDWSRMDRIVTSNYVTSSQAQRKFFTRMIGKVTAGAYSLGANSANILVQDRITGQLQEEKMAVYVRLGIRVLYKGARGGMASARGEFSFRGS